MQSKRSVKNSIDFCYFTQAFCHKKFRGTCSSVKMLKGYMARKRLGTPVINSIMQT